MDQFTKKAHFVPCMKFLSSENTARLFRDNEYRYHGLLDDIVFDWRSQFVVEFWRSLFEILRVDINLSSTFYPQTDGQIERINQVLEQYLWCSINYQQENWTTYLLLAEFAYNNILHASTQQTPFYSNYGFHPKLDLLSSSANSNPAADDFARKLSQIQDILKLQLQATQESYKTSADKFHNQALVFYIRDKVGLLWRNIKTKRPCDKLDYRKFTSSFSCLSFRILSRVIFSR